MSHTPDTVVAKTTGGKFISHPEGQFAAKCADVVDFGEKVEQFPGQPERLVHKVGLVFRTGEVNPENGEYIDIMREFTVSMGEKANLRRFLEDWRGKSYTNDEVEAGAPLHKLVGVACLITVEHRTSGSGRTYANVKGISPLPKPMQAAAPDITGYARAEYLAERKKAYAEDAKKYRAKVNAPTSRHDDDGFDGFPPPQDGTDDLPFN